MVLSDKLGDYGRQLVLRSEFQPILDMGSDYQGGEGRHNLIVGVVLAHLIFDKKYGRFSFPISW